MKPGGGELTRQPGSACLPASSVWIRRRPCWVDGRRSAGVGLASDLQAGEGHLLERPALLADQGDAQRQSGFLVEPEAVPVSPAILRLQVDDLAVAIRHPPRLAQRGPIAIEFAGIGKLAGRIPATGGIGIVADRFDAGADAHHHLVVADHLAMRAGQRDQPHPLMPIIEGMEDTESLDGGARHRDQGAVVIQFGQGRADPFEPVLGVPAPQVAGPGLRGLHPARRRGLLPGRKRWSRQRKQQQDQQGTATHGWLVPASGLAASGSDAVAAESLATTST